MIETVESDWWPTDPDSKTQEYISSHYEFRPEWIRTGRPYSGVLWSNEFISVPNTDAWRLRHDRIMNGLTADLIACAELLDLPLHGQISPGMPGGIGAEGMRAWLPFLDGGVFVDFTQFEHESTNRVHARQKTIVRDAMALRHLIKELGFEPPKARLTGR